ncbi:hypothetical protein [Rossellomorea sp. DA94]|uniref:hypothetical protein n=1 Tax=Rossellomorea sp. DA94 TaxID=3038653 RepID=UPI00244B6227|nr:hypothetical protein [Rossellomorea sp. DA94]WGG45503.1 hypothetical protein P8596_22815 [Rossellomorea sp. DA94]
MSNFNESLKELTGHQINILLNDGTKLSGQLAEVSTEIVTVYSSENETSYYPISQIQSVTKNSKYVKALPVSGDHLKGEKISDVLSQSLLNWVTINGTGKASYSGILSAVEDDHLVLTQGKDRVYLKHSSVLNVYDASKKTTSTNTDSGSSDSSDSASNKENSSAQATSSQKQSSKKSSSKNAKKRKPAFYLDEIEGANSAK